MSINIEQIKSEIESIAKSLGIQKYDVFGTTKEEISASSKNKKPFALKSSNRSSLIIRVWNNNNQVGVTSTSNLSSNGISEALELAYSTAEFGSLENIYDFSDSCLNSNENIMNNNCNNAEFKQMKIEELVEKIVKAETLILENSDVFKSVPYNKISEVFSTKFYFNNLNAFKLENKNISFCYFYPIAQLEGKAARESGHISIVNEFKNLNVIECAETAIKKTKNHLNYQNIKSGKYTVIFSPESFLEILYSFSNFMNAQNILDNKSLSTKEVIGTQIASELLTLFDNPLHDKNPSKTLFDEEGTNTNNIEIIQNGILKTFIHSSFTAKKFKTKSTGHANLGSKLTVSPHFFHISKASNFNNMLSNHPENNIIYIEKVKSLHAGINELQGSFSLPFNGFYINNNLKVSIESATVAGDFFTMLKNIINIGDVEELTQIGISPEIWIKDLSITGKDEN